MVHWNYFILSKRNPSLKEDFLKTLLRYFFHNKSIELLRLPSILGCPEIKSLLPIELQTEENRPVKTHSLSKTISNTILNYKETVNYIVIDDEVSFTINSKTCDCSTSSFCDQDHIITGVLFVLIKSFLINYFFLSR